MITSEIPVIGPAASSSAVADSSVTAQAAESNAEAKAADQIAAEAPQSETVAADRTAEPKAAEPKQDTLHWYALRAFNRKAMRIKADFEAKGFKTYMALRTKKVTEHGHTTEKTEQIIPQLLFVCCPESDLNAYKALHDQDFMVYRHVVETVIPPAKGAKPATRKDLVPAPIPEEQMKTFIYITSTGDGQDIEYYADIMPNFEEGEKVRVVDGIYKGAEGFVKRIKKDRKLLVAIEGVAVVAISRIPINYLEKVQAAKPV